MQLETERRNAEESSAALTAAERKLVLLQTEVADLQAQLAAVYAAIISTFIHRSILVANTQRQTDRQTDRQL